MTKPEEVHKLVAALPIQLGIRLALDRTSFSNPVPDWIQTIAINYAEKEETIRRKISDYLSGGLPKASFTVKVPKKNGKAKTWIVPSVNDQIVLQTCVAAIAHDVYSRSVNRDQVFSYRYNVDPNRLALIEDSIGNWNEFQIETKRRCLSNECILQIDLADAFASIARPSFFGFLAALLPGRFEPKLISNLLDTISTNRTGLPLINDSLFFLGNAYFSQIDNVVRARTSNFIRFVDDYRIFGHSQEELSHLLEQLGPELKHLGFEISSEKIRLGRGQDYLDAVSKLRYEKSTGLERTTEQGSSYINAAIFSDLLNPEEMVNLVLQTVLNPDEHLNEGLGRLQLAAVKKMRLNAAISFERNYFRSLREDFSAQLSSNRDVVRGILDLLRQYWHDPAQTWRSIWLLYISKDIVDVPGKTLAKGLQELLVRIAHATEAPTPVRLWARSSVVPENQHELADLHESEYLECGQRLFG